VWESYGFDGNSNRILWTDPLGAGTGTYDTQDRLFSYGAHTYGYTANGELLSKTQGAASMSYTYDVLGNLRAVTLASGIQIAYRIDGLNRCIGKLVAGTLVQGFLYGDAPTPSPSSTAKAASSPPSSAPPAPPPTPSSRTASPIASSPIP
jgi:YD repeat-containing protein